MITGRINQIALSRARARRARGARRHRCERAPNARPLARFPLSRASAAGRAPATANTARARSDGQSRRRPVVLRAPKGADEASLVASASSPSEQSRRTQPLGLQGPGDTKGTDGRSRGVCQSAGARAGQCHRPLRIVQRRSAEESIPRARATNGDAPGIFNDRARPPRGANDGRGSDIRADGERARVAADAYNAWREGCQSFDGRGRAAPSSALVTGSYRRARGRARGRNASEFPDPRESADATAAGRFATTAPRAFRTKRAASYNVALEGERRVPKYRRNRGARERESAKPTQPLNPRDPPLLRRRRSDATPYDWCA